MKLISLLLFLTVSLSSHGQNWQTVNTTNLPLARHENAFVCCADQFYLLGGRQIKPIQSYSPKDKTWKEGPTPPIEIHHFQAISIGKEIWIIGAMTGKYPSETPLEHILIYNTETQEWKEGAKYPQGRQRGSCGTILFKDKLYLFSGIVDGHNGNYTNWTDCYDLKTKTWHKLADAPHKRDHFAAIEINGKVVCAGGRQTSKKTNEVFTKTVKEVDIYDIKSNTWTTTAEGIPTPRAGCSGVALGTKAIIIGGESGSQDTAHQEVEAYDIKTGKWETLPPLKRGRHGTQALVYKGKIYICAGSGKRGGRPELSSLEVYSEKE